MQRKQQLREAKEGEDLMKHPYTLLVFEINMSIRIFQTSISCAAEKHEQCEQKLAMEARISEWAV